MWGKTMSALFNFTVDRNISSTNGVSLGRDVWDVFVQIANWQTLKPVG